MPTIKPRPKTYIIGKPVQIPADAVDFEFDELIDEINNLSEAFGTQNVVGETTESAAEVIRKLSTVNGDLESLVVKMNNEIKNQLEQKHKGAIIIESDDPIFPFELNELAQATVGPEIPLILNIVPTEESLIVRIAVKGPDGEPVSKARVTIAGLLWVDSGLTNTSGQVKLTLLGETADSISAIEVKPASTYWSFQIEQPAINADEDNEIVLKKIRPLESDGGGADNKQFVGWGQQRMQLVGQPAQSEPIKIAVIDSGIFAGHPDLSPSRGFDFGDTNEPEDTWQTDGSGHGTHVAGICAAQDNKMGILGFAPEAELIVLRVFPNASNSKLIDALDWCIDHEVDVINMSLGGKNGSELVRQRIQACRENGILAIAAAGNNGAEVLFPAAFSEVLAVSAVGHFGTFPDDSAHRRHIGENPIQSGDYFSPQFTCRGPEINVCAPGVAITSCVPDGGIAAWDGTSMACPHVAGLAARLLQMRGDLRDLGRKPERSQALFDTITDMCVFLDGIPEIYQGKGIPRLQLPTDAVTSELEEVAKLVDAAIRIVEGKLVDV